MRTVDFDYPLPEELIADRPMPDRDASRMLVVHRDTGLIEHRCFRDLPEYVRPGDRFVMNDTKVIPARYFSNDGSIELVRAGMMGEQVWKCLVRPGKGGGPKGGAPKGGREAWGRAGKAKGQTRGKQGGFQQKGMGPNKASGHKGGMGRQGSKRG